MVVVAFIVDVASLARRASRAQTSLSRTRFTEGGVIHHAGASVASVAEGLADHSAGSKVLLHRLSSGKQAAVLVRSIVVEDHPFTLTEAAEQLEKT